MLANEDEFSAFSFLNDCESKLKSNANIALVWKSSVVGSADRLHLDKSDLRLLISIGEILGSSDSHSQAEEFGLLSGFIGKNLESASAAYSSYGRLYRSLGVLCGIGAAIVLI